MNKRIIIYIVVIIVILVAVFFSQQAVSRTIGKNLISAATSQASAYLTKSANLAIPSIGSEIGKQLQNGEGAIQNIVESAKEKISDAEKNIENYFSGIKNAVTGKSSNNCPTPTSETSTK